MNTTIRLGEITIHSIVEDEGAYRPMLDLFPDLRPEQLEEARPWLGAALDAEDGAVFRFQCYVVQLPGMNVLVDSCIGNDKERPARASWHRKTDSRFLDGLAAIGLTVADIDVVMCTHLHADHVGWNTRLENGRWVPTFPRARYLFSAKELAHWQAQNAKAPVAALVDSVLPVVAAGRAELIGSDFELTEALRLLPTPGHTPDHFAVRLGHGRDRAVLTGDLIHSPIQLAHPELSPSFDVDPVLAAQTRRAFLERYAETDTLCCTVHFPGCSCGHIRRAGTGFRCEAPAGA